MTSSGPCYRRRGREALIRRRGKAVRPAGGSRSPRWNLSLAPVRPWFLEMIMRVTAVLIEIAGTKPGDDT